MPLVHGFFIMHLVDGLHGKGNILTFVRAFDGDKPAIDFLDI